ncbi:MAG TPA: hypothetical protein VK681_12515 [Reyranella sp.]|nr:hypothetical protein [Reyranella sp.]
MFKFIPTTAVPGFRVGRPDDDELGFNVADDGSTPPVLRGAPDVPAVDDNYPFGTTSPGFVAPQAPSPNPFVPPGTGSPLPPAGDQMPTNPMAQTGSLPLDPRGYGGAFNYARYVPDNPIDQAGPAAEPPSPLQKTSGGTDFNPIGSAQAQTPQAQQPGTSLEVDPSPGEAVVLPDGLTIPSVDSPTTGQVMSPVADLTPVAAAGRQAGLRYRAMLDNPQTAPLAPFYLATALGASLGHAGTFDYQRRGNIITGYTQLPQFREVSNINVGIFAQQAGLTLDETLKLAETFAWGRSNNYHRDQPNGLDDKTAQFIRSGFNIAKTGVFGPPAP